MTGGGFAVQVLLSVLALLAVGLFVWNLLGFISILKIRSDGRQGRILRVKAVVKWSVPARIGSSRAAAEYSIGERKIRGRMIGASGERLTEGQTVKVFVSERKPGLFAVDERQINSAASAYVVMCLVFLIIAAFLIFIVVKYITSA